MKQKSKWLTILMLFMLALSIQVSAQERKQVQSDHEISVEEELLIEKQQLMENMTVEEKAAYLKHQKIQSSEKQTNENLSERDRKIKALREKENLKRSNYSQYVEMYGESTSELIQIPQEKFNSYPEERQQYILNNPQRFKIINKEK